MCRAPYIPDVNRKRQTYERGHKEPPQRGQVCLSVVDFKEILEPLRDLFKDEVRKVGVALGLPDSIVMRQPFPGPGLAIRVLGVITPEKLGILREADYIFRTELESAGLNRDIWQYFVVLTNAKSVGVREISERTATLLRCVR